ncbi:MAG: hypothetical protein HYZ40_04035 [Rhodospirillales bacterium]|nr:hypothetical protein [Rhodospirillales bacterium]
MAPNAPMPQSASDSAKVSPLGTRPQAIDDRPRPANITTIMAGAPKRSEAQPAGSDMTPSRMLAGA